MVLIAVIVVSALAGLVVFICFWPDLKANHVPAAEVRRAVERLEEGFADDAASVAERRMTRAHAQFDNSGVAYWRRVHRALLAREKRRRNAARNRRNEIDALMGES